MTMYPAEQKRNLIERMLPPQNADVPRLSRETGIAKATLYGWRRQARRARGLTPTVVAGGGERWRAEETCAMGVETAARSEAERGDYCRKRGLYPEQRHAWRRTCAQAHADQGVSRRPTNGEGAADKRRIRKLEQELRRKEKALAEAAAWRVLRNAAIWGTDEAVGSAPAIARTP